MKGAAEQLEGAELPGGWKVTSKLERTPARTGSHFSCGYFVEGDDGRKGFLKALDYSGALRSPDPAQALNAMTAAYNFEADLCEKCKDRHMRRVVTAVGKGTVYLDPNDPVTVVQYLIFEQAENDVRVYLDKFDAFDTAWVLRALHHVATGLNELHMAGIAHQDVKPSNVLVFPQEGSKVADLGRAADKETAGPFDEWGVAGDQGYAPPELLYRHVAGDWNTRRFGCDAYLLGSMVVFFFARVSMTALILDNLDESYHWRIWPGTFQDVMPYIRDAFGRAVASFLEDVPEDTRAAISPLVRELCEPDPRLRGHPRTRVVRGNQYSVERYVSTFDMLASKAEYGLIGR